jgi:hypothetical protein
MSQGQSEGNIHEGPDLNNVVCKYEVNPLVNNKLIASYSKKQENFTNLTLTIRGSAVHKNHNYVQSNYRVIALCYFSIVFFSCPEHNLKTTSWNSIQFHTMVKYIERKRSAQKP